MSRPFPEGFPGRLTREEVRAALISASPERLAALSPEAVASVERALADELQAGGGAEDPAEARLRWGSAGVSVHQGDITRLRVDGIVNAANSALLGCFQPDHRCVDNVIHARAGPRLRLACAAELARLHPECAPGQWEEPVGRALVTPAFALPSSFVLHTVGPQARFRGDEQPELLASCYTSCLEAASERGLSSLAFCCVSTGLFGYPPAAAARVATSAVRQWLQDHPASPLRLVVFCVYLDSDAAIYREVLQLEPAAPAQAPAKALGGSDEVRVAARMLRSADAVLVVAGAGMSALGGYNVYVDPQDFAREYPGMPAHGYRTAYECMGLKDDETVPRRVRAGFYLQHSRGMRWRYPLVHAGYQALLRIASRAPSGYQVLTSNVDGAFLRAGFEPGRVYRPQGDWEWMQCGRGCHPSAYWPALPVMERLEPLVDRATQSLPSDSDAPRCPRCGYFAFGNVRGGDWFLHHPELAEAKARLVSFVRAARSRAEEALARGQQPPSLVVVEVGAGHSTPIVTRYPAESVVRDVPGARLIRVNPDDPSVPSDLADRAVCVPSGWEALVEVDDDIRRQEAEPTSREEAALAAERCWKRAVKLRSRGRPAPAGIDWEVMLEMLAR